tara:strand:+ start:62394 stop:62702 length:309 start_codon:yes stop_codon:yes gene_type:complete
MLYHDYVNLIKKGIFTKKLTVKVSQDLYQAPDYFQMDELLTEEHRLIQKSVRNWAKKEISPIIEDACQKAKFPKEILKGLGEIGAVGPYITGMDITGENTFN